MKVALISANIANRYGGPAVAAPSFAKALAAVGADVRLVTTDQDGDQRLKVPLGRAVKQHGYETWYYPAGLGSRSRPWAMAWASGIGEAVRWADIVHVNSLYLPHNLFTYQASCRSATPYVVRPHGILEPYQRRQAARMKGVYDWVFGSRYLSSAAAVHFASTTEAERAADRVPSMRSFVVPVPVAIGQAPATTEEARVLFMGRVTAKKRLDLLLDAWGLVAQRHPEARLVIAGPVDRDQAHVIARARETVGVQVEGTVRGESKISVIRSAAVFVLASENENFGVAVAEAMAQGVPVVVSPEVALSEEVNQSGAGFVVPLQADHLAAAIARLLTDRDLGRELGRRGYQLVAERLSHEAVGARLADELTRVVGSSMAD